MPKGYLVLTVMMVQPEIILLPHLAMSWILCLLFLCYYSGGVSKPVLDLVNPQKK